MIHDFCGGLEEELMRTNFILVYELIDEIIVILRSVFIFILGLWPSIDYPSRSIEEIRTYQSWKMLYRNYV